MPATRATTYATSPAERPVEVLHEGRWLPGTLLHAYLVGERWRAVVRYYTGAGSQFQQARWAEDVRRPADSP